MPRPRKPSKLKLIGGNPGNPRSNEPEPDAYTLDRPPTWLKNRIARQHWRRLAPVLQEAQILAVTDLPALALICEAHQIYEEAMAMIRAEGLTVESTKNTTMKHPACRIAESQRDFLRQMYSEFGLSPSSRSRVSKIQNQGDGGSEWDQFD